MSLGSTPWPKFRGNSIQNIGTTSNVSNSVGVIKWSFPTGNSVLGSAAIGSDGTIYIESRDGFSYAINPDGTQKWKLAIPSTLAVFFLPTPAIDSNGIIYFGSQNNNALYSINPDSSQNWTFNTVVRCASPTIGPDGTIYVGSDQTASGFFAINPNGTQKWVFSTGSRERACAAIAPDGTIYIGTAAAQMFAINPDGTQKWVFNATFPADLSRCSPAVDSNGNIFIGAVTNNPGIYGVNPNGTQKWFRGFLHVYSSPAIDSNGNVIVGNENNTVVSLNPSNGNTVWSFPTGGIIDASPVIDGKGIIYVGSQDGFLYALNSDGTQKYRVATSNGISSVAIGADGTLYLGNDGSVVAIESKPSNPIVSGVSPLIGRGASIKGGISSGRGRNKI